MTDRDKIEQEAEARVVAWLRKGFDTYPHGTFARCSEMQSYWSAAADAIARREHLPADLEGDK